MNIKQIFNTLSLVAVFICFYPPIVGARSVERLEPVVVAKFSHDPQAFTQGLAIEDDELYESTGLYGQSSLRHLDILSGEILKKHFLPSDCFAEGLAAFSHQLLQITWREQRTFTYERESFFSMKVLFYHGEGWGLCREGNTIWMSNGTCMLTQRDPESFEILKSLRVHWNGRPVSYLNDLECDGNHLYANVWQKDWIIRIDKMNGDVTGIIDASRLLSPEERACLGRDDVLNGLAFRAKKGTFFLTGKRWPWIFEVRFIPKK